MGYRLRDARMYGCILFCTTQDTIFFILVVDTLMFACRGSRPEIEVAMKVENEHLTEVAHLGVLRVRCKGGDVFGLDAVALDGEGIHQHGTEAPSRHPMRASSLGTP